MALQGQAPDEANDREIDEHLLDKAQQLTLWVLDRRLAIVADSLPAA